MKFPYVLGALAVAAGLLGASHAALAPQAAAGPLASLMAGPGFFATGVRAEYANVGGRLADSTCQLTNTSASDSITLREVILLGPAGTGSILSIHQGFVGQVVPPLGSVELRIDSNIAGIVRETSANGPGVRRVVFVWVGSEGQVELDAVIETSNIQNIYTRAEFVEHGFDVQP